MSDEEDCSVCNGTGIAPVEFQNIESDQPAKYKKLECEHCGGTGKEP